MDQINPGVINVALSIERAKKCKRSEVDSRLEDILRVANEETISALAYLFREAAGITSRLLNSGIERSVVGEILIKTLSREDLSEDEAVAIYKSDGDHIRKMINEGTVSAHEAAGEIQAALSTLTDVTDDDKNAFMNAFYFGIDTQ